MKKIKKYNFTSGDKVTIKLVLNCPQLVVDKIKKKLIEIDDIINEYETISEYAIQKLEETKTVIFTHSHVSKENETLTTGLVPNTIQTSTRGYNSPVAPDNI